MKNWLAPALLLLSSVASAQQEMELWPDHIPPYLKPAENLEFVDEDCWGGVRCARHVVTPTLTIYPAEEHSDKWLIIAPGGGYDSVAIDHEGSQIAEAFAARGITSAVLKYRVPDKRTSTKPQLVPFTDFYKAMRMLRAEQEAAGIENGQIGFVGFSASGHLAVYSMVHPVPEEHLNVDFAVIAYGTSDLNPVNEDWLEKNLYYRSMTREEKEKEMVLNHVTSDTPPAFLVHAVDDDVSIYTETTLLADALRKNGVEAEVHLFATGGHGFGPGRDEDGTSQWIDLATNWIKRR